MFYLNWKVAVNYLILICFLKDVLPGLPRIEYSLRQAHFNDFKAYLTLSQVLTFCYNCLNDNML